MARTIFSASARNCAMIEFDDFDGSRSIRSFYALVRGGYVRESVASGNDPQVCRMLLRTGATLDWPGHEPLLDLIKREWRRAKRAFAV